MRLNVRTQVLDRTPPSPIADLHLLFEAFVGHHELMYRFSYVMGIGSMGLIGVLSAHQLETQARLAFLQRRVIRASK